MASPFSPIKKPLLEAMSIPSALNVVNVKMDFDAFAAHFGFSAKLVSPAEISNNVIIIFEFYEKK